MTKALQVSGVTVLAIAIGLYVFNRLRQKQQQISPSRSASPPSQTASSSETISPRETDSPYLDPKKVEVCWDSARVDPHCDFTKVTTLFGYGSLVWKPPSDIVRAFPVKIKGWHRRFWQSSVDHRGTPQFPGRVVTLLADSHPAASDLQPGDTWGMCFEIRDLQRILPQLDEREKHGYTRTLVEVFDDEDQSRGEAVMYFAQPGADPAFLGPESDEEVARVIQKAVGPSGTNRQYLLELHKWCQSRGIEDEHVSTLVRLVAQLDSAS